MHSGNNYAVTYLILSLRVQKVVDFPGCHLGKLCASLKTYFSGLTMPTKKFKYVICPSGK